MFGNKKTPLKIEGFEDITCKTPVKGSKPVSLQINPEQIEFTYGFEAPPERKRTNATGQSAQNPLARGDYSPLSLSIETLVDATGVILADAGSIKLDTKEGVLPFIEELKRNVYYYLDSTHGPPYVKVTWGKVMPKDVRDGGGEVFRGRLENMKVTYTMFSLKGIPIRAAISMEFQWVEPPNKRPTGNSPDLTHFIEVKHGDNLPALCKKIYDSPDFFMQIARINNLSSVYALKPGMKLLFPPLEKASR